MKTDGWIEMEGTVESVTETPTRGGSIYTVAFSYKVNDQWCGGTFHTYYEYRKDDSVTLKYDPANPDRNDLVEHEKLNHWIVFGVVAVAVLIGIYVVFLK